MQRFSAWILLFAMIHGLLAQTPPAVSKETAVRSQFAALEPGKLVTLKLTSGKMIQGSVIGRNEETVDLRVARPFFRHRTESYSLKDIVSIKKERGAWVGPVIVLAIVVGAAIGVAACVSNGACSK